MPKKILLSQRSLSIWKISRRIVATLAILFLFAAGTVVYIVSPNYWSRQFDNYPTEHSRDYSDRVNLRGNNFMFVTPAVSDMLLGSIPTDPSRYYDCAPFNEKVHTVCPLSG
jgi:hypothetical protein